jgi:outer membrane autotransporter protein
LHRRKLILFLLACLGPVLALGSALPARSAVFTVTRTDDDMSINGGAGTLRKAISDLNAAAAGTHDIAFNIAAGSTITLDGPTLLMTNSATVNLGGTADISITGPVDTVLLQIAAGARADTKEIDVDWVLVDTGGTYGIAVDPGGQTVAGDITGSGVVEKNGTGLLDFQGAVTADPFMINFNGLQIDPDDLDADLEVSTYPFLPGFNLNGQVIFHQDALDPSDPSDLGTYSGDISEPIPIGDPLNPNCVVKSGIGTVIFTGTHTHQCGTEVQSGTLQGSTDNLPGDVDIADGAILRFDQTSDGSFAGTLTGLGLGLGRVEKTGAGTLTFNTAAPTSNLSELRIIAGTLRAEDYDPGTPGLQAPVIDSPLLVNLGGTFSGVAELNADASVHGRMHPDLVARADPASIRGTSRITFEPGATLIVEVRSQGSAGGDSSRIETSGGVVFENGLTLDVQAGTDDPVSYTSERSFLVATNANNADAGASPDEVFTTIRTSSPFLTARTDIQATDFYVYVSRTSGQSLAITENQKQVAAAYDVLTAPGNSTTDTSALESAMLSLTGLQVPAAFDSMGGDMLASFTTTRFTNSDRFAHTVAERFTASQYELRYPKTSADRFTRNALSEDSPFGRFATPTSTIGANMGSGLLGSSPYTFSPGRERDGLGAFVDGFAVFSSIDGGAESSSIDSRIFGTTLGLDYRLPTDFWLPSAEHIRIGVAGSYAHSSFSSNPTPASGTSNNYYASLYGSYTLSRFYVGLLGRYGYADMSTERPVELGSLTRPFAETALGSFNGHEASGYVETGALIGDPESVLFRPTLAYNYTWLDQNPFTETDAPTVGLDVEGTSATSKLMTLGLRVSKVIPFDPELFGGGPADEYGIEPELRFGWNREFGTRLRNVDAGFTSAIDGGTFTVASAETEVDSFTIGIGHTMRFHDIALVAMHYDARLDSTRVDHNIRAALYFAW